MTLMVDKQQEKIRYVRNSVAREQARLERVAREKQEKQEREAKQATADATLASLRRLVNTGAKQGRVQGYPLTAAQVTTLLETHDKMPEYARLSFASDTIPNMLRRAERLGGR